MSWFTLYMILINTAFWIVCCFGIAWGVRLFPKALYEKSCWFFKVHPFERRLYRSIRLERWKDQLPEWGKVWKFEKKHLKKEISVEYIDKFILETYYAEIGHLGMALFGFACILVNPNEYAQMALICSFVNLVIQIPFCLIQRYNRPRLLMIRKRLSRRE